MENRRTFLAKAGILACGLIIGPGALLAKQQHTIGLQLYTLRDQLPVDVKSVIKKVADSGYKEIETFGYNQAYNGYWGLPNKDFAQLLKDLGLNTPSGHYDFNQFFTTGGTDDINAYIKAAHILGQKFIIIPALHPELFQTVDDFKKVSEKMNAAGILLKKEGLKLGYHNHNFEWKPIDGTTFYDTLLDNTDPELLYLELDIFFMKNIGQDPIAYLDKYKNRYRLVHIKDMDKANQDENTEVGNGAIDFKLILAKAKKVGVKYLIVEQENFTNIDPFVSIKQSGDYVKNIL
ncbi:sugar phosphate isomerase/epimerase family protein [Mucilaginibacter sp. SP1R1]|uniref:sugar phosphate isomerase/epimerase family protein n=1 Tax=Mucilaginibacter sp. SP1R1 TaxID=2723091 RepID=UPI0016202134|nr:sugar phosphate isomerase/epimerase [Mucilaginibacter sp. SP1R1]MBB6148338.1 sugar phosphate isomerase/epimerase [Mucilaginibacter sp. SP1R1]